jgi:hypothetical protein
VLFDYGGVGIGEDLLDWRGDATLQGEDLVGELNQAMGAHGSDPTPIREAMGR